MCPQPNRGSTGTIVKLQAQSFGVWLALSFTMASLHQSGYSKQVPVEGQRGERRWGCPVRLSIRQRTGERVGQEMTDSWAGWLAGGMCVCVCMSGSVCGPAWSCSRPFCWQIGLALYGPVSISTPRLLCTSSSLTVSSHRTACSVHARLSDVSGSNCTPVCMCVHVGVRTLYLKWIQVSVHVAAAIVEILYMMWLCQTSGCYTSGLVFSRLAQSLSCTYLSLYSSGLTSVIWHDSHPLRIILRHVLNVAVAGSEQTVKTQGQNYSTSCCTVKATNAPYTSCGRLASILPFKTVFPQSRFATAVTSRPQRQDRHCWKQERSEVGGSSGIKVTSKSTEKYQSTMGWFDFVSRWTF